MSNWQCPNCQKINSRGVCDSCGWGETQPIDDPDAKHPEMEKTVKKGIGNERPTQTA